MEAKLGMVVRSIAGHDQGNFLVITAIEDDFAYIADGKERKLDSPKKKAFKTSQIYQYCYRYRQSDR